MRVGSASGRAGRPSRATHRSARVRHQAELERLRRNVRQRRVAGHRAEAAAEDEQHLAADDGRRPVAASRARQPRRAVVRQPLPERADALLAEEVEATELEQKKIRSALEYELERIEELRVREVIDSVHEKLAEVGDIPGDRGEALRDLKLDLERAKADTRLQQRRMETAKGLRKGDAVFVPRLQKVCEVKKINKEKQKLVVVLNGVATEVRFQEISWVLPPPGFDLWWYCDE